MIFNGGANLPTGSAISILIRMANSAAATNVGLFEIGSTAFSVARMAYIQAHKTSAAVWHLNHYTQQASNNTVIGDDSGYTETEDTTTFHDWVITWDGTTGANKYKLWRDGTAVRSLTASNASSSNIGTMAQVIKYIALGKANPQVGTAIKMYIDEFAIFDTEIVPSTGVTLSNGAVAALNGSSRTLYVDCAALDGTTNTDPGIANVKSGTGYTIAGASLTGTAVIPALSDTKTGVAGYGGTGTYDGSDRWTCPAAADILDSAAAIKCNSASTNRTGTYASPATTDVKSGVAYGPASGLTGTYTVAAGGGGKGDAACMGYIPSFWNLKPTLFVEEVLRVANR